MMPVFNCHLPLPPSTNGLFATFNGRRIKTREYRAWQQEAGLLIKARWAATGRIKFEGPVSFRALVGINRRRDLDNCVKPLIDALVDSYPDFPNDRWVDRISLFRAPQVEGTIISVTQLADDRDEARSIGELANDIVETVAAKMMGEAA